MKYLILFFAIPFEKYGQDNFCIPECYIKFERKREVFKLQSYIRI